MRKGMMVAMVATMSIATPAFALDLNDILSTVDLGGAGAGLPLVGDTGIALDGIAEVGLLGTTLISSENAEPLISANILDASADASQSIADVTVGGSDLQELDDLLHTLALGDVLGGGTGGDGGSGDLVGGVLDTVGGLTGGLTGGGNDGGSSDLVGGVLDTVGGLTGGLTGGGNGGGSSDLVGGVADAVGGLTGGLTGGGNGGGSNDLVGGATGAVGGLVGGLTRGLLN